VVSVRGRVAERCVSTDVAIAMKGVRRERVRIMVEERERRSAVVVQKWVRRYMAQLELKRRYKEVEEAMDDSALRLLGESVAKALPPHLTVVSVIATTGRWKHVEMGAVLLLVLQDHTSIAPPTKCCFYVRQRELVEYMRRKALMAPHSNYQFREMGYMALREGLLRPCSSTLFDPPAAMTTPQQYYQGYLHSLVHPSLLDIGKSPHHLAVDSYVTSAIQMTVQHMIHSGGGGGSKGVTSRGGGGGGGGYDNGINRTLRRWASFLDGRVNLAMLSTTRPALQDLIHLPQSLSDHVTRMEEVMMASFDDLDSLLTHEASAFLPVEAEMGLTYGLAFAEMGSVCFMQDALRGEVRGMVGVRGQCGIPTYAHALSYRKSWIERMLHQTRKIDQHVMALKSELNKEVKLLNGHRRAFHYLCRLRRYNDGATVVRAVRRLAQVVWEVCDKGEEVERKVLYHASAGRYTRVRALNQVLEEQVRAIQQGEQAWVESLQLMRDSYR